MCSFVVYDKRRKTISYNLLLYIDNAPLKIMDCGRKYTEYYVCWHLYFIFKTYFSKYTL